MLATATVKLKAIAPQLGHALRETRDRLLPELLRPRPAAAAYHPGAPATVADDATRLVASVTTSRRDILAAQRLRYRVFTGEYGATFAGLAGIAGIDRDRYDRYCRHLVVKDSVSGQVIAYTRILGDGAARKAGGWYSAGEFRLGMVDRLEGRVLEIGRTCVHPDYRNGAAIGVLWAALAEVLYREGYRYLFGCASIPLSAADSGAMLAEVARREEQDARFRVTPHVALPLPRQAGEGSVKLPPLLRTYLTMGAKVCGAPCWDPDFNCADVFILLDVEAIPARYARHFLGRAADAVAA